MNVEQLKEVKVEKPTPELPPMPRYLAVYALRDERSGKISWNVTELPRITSSGAFAEAMFQGTGYKTIESTIRVFEIPEAKK